MINQILENIEIGCKSSKLSLKEKKELIELKKFILTKKREKELNPKIYGQILVGMIRLLGDFWLE